MANEKQRLTTIPPSKKAPNVIIDMRTVLQWGVEGMLVVASLLAAPLAAEDWPQFRGPTAQGHAAAKNLPTEFSAEKNIAWKVPLFGEGWSSPVIVGERIFLTSAVPHGEGRKGYSLRALCFSTKSGDQLWNEEIFSTDASTPAIHSKNSHASPTPLVHEGKLYVHFGHEGSACLTLDGKLLWKSDDVKYSPVHGNGGSPVIVGEHLIFSTDGASNPAVVALNRNSGKLVWRTPRSAVGGKKFSFSTPLVMESNGRPLVISPGPGMVGAYDPETGAEVWRARYGEGYSVIPRPVFAHGLLFVSSGYDTAVAYAVRPGGMGDVTDTHIAWSLDRGAPHTPSMLVVDDNLYMVSDRGVATCVNAKSGESIWQKRLGGNFSASPIFADGKIYVLSEEGKMTVFAPGEKLEVLGESDLAERTLASPAVADDAIFLRSDKHLYRIESMQ